MKPKTRCAWVNDDPIYIEYHDKEWGVPIYDDRLLFEFLMLEGMQAGLSWITILKRRDHYRAAFANFDAKKIIQYNDAKVDALMDNAGIIRHRLKIEAIITNAKIFLETQQEFGSFSKYLWGFVGGKPIKNKWKTTDPMPATTDLSDKLAKDLKKRGFKFVGSTICYAFMQAVGMVDDHTVDCLCYNRASL